MAGAMGVHKNKFVEEWSGRREVSERTFDIGVEWPGLIAKLVIPTGLMYYYIKAEQVRTQNIPAHRPGCFASLALPLCFSEVSPLLLPHLRLSPARASASATLSRLLAAEAGRESRQVYGPGSLPVSPAWRRDGRVHVLK